MWDSSHAHTHYTINQIVANPWNPISPREAHWDVLIRSDLPLMCRGPPTIVCFEGEQNRERHGPQSGQYLHSWGGVVTDGIRAMP